MLKFLLPNAIGWHCRIDCVDERLLMGVVWIISGPGVFKTHIGYE